LVPLPYAPNTIRFPIDSLKNRIGIPKHNCYSTSVLLVSSMRGPWKAYSPDTGNPPFPARAEALIASEHSDSSIVRLWRLASRISCGASREEILSAILKIVTDGVTCDSCTVYVAEGGELVRRACSNPHIQAANRLKVKTVLCTMRWAAGNWETLVATRNAHVDPRVRMFFNGPLEDGFECFLSIPMVSGGRLEGAINVRNREHFPYGERETNLIAALSYLVGSELERARLELKNVALRARLESRDFVERAKGILQRNLQIDEEDAYLTLQRESRNRRKSMREVAETIILNDVLKTNEHL
jgi:GAF domain-containing protein